MSLASGPQTVSQASQQFRSSEPEAISGDCFSHQPISSVICRSSSTPGAAEPHWPSKTNTDLKMNVRTVTQSGLPIPLFAFCSKPNCSWGSCVYHAACTVSLSRGAEEDYSLDLRRVWAEMSINSTSPLLRIYIIWYATYSSLNNSLLALSFCSELVLCILSQPKAYNVRGWVYTSPISLVYLLYNCIVPLEFLLWEIWVAFSGESQLRHSLATQPIVLAGCLIVSVIRRTLTWTARSLTWAQMLMCEVAHEGVRTP